jgi:restriction endonuclease Mrr
MPSPRGNARTRQEAPASPCAWGLPSEETREALDFVDRIEGKKVVLIDGERLAELMIDHNVGVTTSKVYELREVSNDFFDEDEG